MSKFDEIIGYSTEKKELQQIADILKNRDVYRDLGVAAPRGLLLFGDPGVGKTLMANALIEASGRPVFTCRKDQPNGEFVKELKATFEKAVASAPSIVFLDDMDKFANGDTHHRNAEEYVTVQSCMDEMKGEEVFVLATANEITNLPASLLRAGRFDRHMEITVPRGGEAEKIIAHYLSNKKTVNSIDVKTIAKIMDGHSCAELETVINEAGLYAGFERAEEITMEHFTEACLKVIFNVSRDEHNDLDCCANSEGNDRIAYHEAGHAVVSEILCPGSVTLISAHRCRGREGGFTAYYDDHTRSSYQWKESRILASLGGMAATEQKFGDMDDGNSSDLEQAYDIICDFVTRNCSCGFHLYGEEYRIPEGTREKQQETVAHEIERYYRKTKEIIVRNQVFLEKLATALKEKGLLTMQEVQEIRNLCAITSVAA